MRPLLTALDRPWSFFIAASVSMFSLFPFARTLRASRGPTLFLGVCAVALFCCGSIFLVSAYLREGIVELILCLALGLLAAAFSRSSECLFALLILGMGQAVYCLYQTMTTSGGTISADLFRSGGTFGNTIVAGTMFGCVAPAAALFGLVRGSAWLQACAALIWLGLTMTWSRGPMAGAALGVVGALWVSRSTWSFDKTRSIAVFGIVVITIASFAVRNLTPQRSLSTTRSDVGRIHQWEAAGNFFVSNPLGVGPGGVMFDLIAYVPGKGSRVIQSDDAKNETLMMLDTFGVLGVVLEAAIIIGIWRVLSSSNSPTSVCLKGVFISLAIISCFDSPFFVDGREVTLGWLGLFAGLVMKVDCEEKQNCLEKLAFA